MLYSVWVMCLFVNSTMGLLWRIPIVIHAYLYSIIIAVSPVAGDDFGIREEYISAELS